MISKKLHFIWFGLLMPLWVKRNIARWQTLNPDWQVRVHGTEVLASVYTELYDRIDDLCSKSDLLRLSILRTLGGWYFDCDFVPLKPLDELYEQYDIDHIFLTKQWGEHGKKWVANGIFGIEPDSPAWPVIDRMVEENSRGRLQRTSFGPLLTTRLVEEGDIEIPLSPPEEFYPWRPPMKDCIQKFEKLWGGNFASSSMAATACTESTAAHLWLGGEYNQPSLDRLARKF